VVAHPLPVAVAAAGGAAAAGGFEEAGPDAGSDTGADVAGVAADELADDLVDDLADGLVDGLAAGDVAARSLEVARTADGAEGCWLAAGVLGVHADSAATAAMAGIMRAVDRFGMDITGTPHRGISSSVHQDAVTRRLVVPGFSEFREPANG
jgi:hypothetical protein